MRSNPLISIIVPCYNQSHFLDECLQSVVEQVYQNWECIIVNDGSPDNTENVALQWINKDSRFKYIKKKNGGLSSARNEGIKISKSEWILPLDADDKIDNEYLFLAEKEFNKDYTVIYCNAKLFGAVEKKWDLVNFSEKNLARNNVIFCSAFFRKDSWNNVGGYDENLKAGLEDWDFWVSILKYSPHVFKIPKICFFYRIKEDSMLKSLKKDENIRIETLKYIYKKHSDFFIDQLDPFDDLYTKKEELEKVYNSKRYKIGDSIISFINKFRITK